VAPRRHRVADPHLAARLFGRLRLQDGVGAVRQRRPGHDPHGLAGSDGARERPPRQRLADDDKLQRVVRPRAERLAALQCIPVHRGAVERRHGDIRHDLGRQHPPGRVGQPDGFRRQRRQTRGEQGHRVGDLGAVLEAAHAHVFPLRITDCGLRIQRPLSGSVAPSSFVHRCLSIRNPQPAICGRLLVRPAAVRIGWGSATPFSQQVGSSDA